MMPRISPVAALLLSASAALLMSCRKPEARVYLAPRDATPAPAPVAAETPAPPKQPERPKPKITYTLPPGWTETAPGQVSLVAFAIKGEGVEANVNVTALADLRGRELQVVNMYRQQTGQPPLEEAELGKTLVPVEVAGGPGQMFEFLGSNHDKPTRLITVIAHRDGRSWFYRLSGDDAFATAQKAAFLDFIKSVQISEAPAPPESASTEAPPKAQP
jgi:hypothetical protein